jgi:hypothetical protein
MVLPRWKEILEDLAAAATTTDNKPLLVCVMPHDVPTHWKSTYEMLKFAFLYRKAIDTITGDCAMNLRDYELLEAEWKTVKRLCDSLKVYDSL